MPPQNHHGGPRPGGRPSAPSLPAQFDATYDPSGLRTVSSGGPGGYGGYGGGHGGGGGDFDPAALMDLVYGYKQRGADADLARREKTEREERIRARDQANLLRAHTPQPVSKERQFMMNKAYLDRQMSPLANYAGSHGLQTNPDFFNMPAASALTYGKDVFPNGWDQYAKIAAAGGR